MFRVSYVCLVYRAAVALLGEISGELWYLDRPQVEFHFSASYWLRNECEWHTLIAEWGAVPLEFQPGNSSHASYINRESLAVRDINLYKISTKQVRGKWLEIEQISRCHGNAPGSSYHPLSPEAKERWQRLRRSVWRLCRGEGQPSVEGAGLSEGQHNGLTLSECLQLWRVRETDVVSRKDLRRPRLRDSPAEKLNRQEGGLNSSSSSSLQSFSGVVPVVGSQPRATGNVEMRQRMGISVWEAIFSAERLSLSQPLVITNNHTAACVMNVVRWPTHIGGLTLSGLPFVFQFWFYNLPVSCGCWRWTPLWCLVWLLPLISNWSPGASLWRA